MSTASAAKMTISCPQCAAQFKVPTSVAGRKGRCAKCQAIVLIPLAEPELLQPLYAPAVKATAMRAAPELKPIPSQPSFDDAFGDYQLMAQLPQVTTSLPPTNPFQSPVPIANSYNPSFAPEPAKKKDILDAGLLAGIAITVGGLLLFAVGLSAGRLRVIYLSFLLVIMGIATGIRGLTKLSK
jgi:predicted Zn finger-like uncharacterized protein